MSAADFKKYLSAVSSALWGKFRKNHKAQIKMVLWAGIGGFSAAVVFEKVNAIALVAVFAMLFGVLTGFSLLMSASTYSTYVANWKWFYKGRRDQMMLSNSYEEYLNFEKLDKG